MKKWTGLMLAIVMALTLLPAMAQEEIVTLDQYTPKVPKVTFQTTNRVIPEGNRIDQWIESELKAEVEWIILPNDELRTKLNLLATSGELPDLVSIPSGLTDLYQSFVEQGLFLDLEPLMKKYAPNIYKYRTQEQIDALRAPDGKIYAINSNAETDFDMFAIRTDWLAKVGLAMPATLDEFTEVLRAFKTKDPDGNGANDTTGLGGIKNISQTFSPIWAAYGANPGQWVWLEDNTIGYGPAQPALKDAVAYLQSLYAEGLILESFAVTEDGDKKAFAATNKFGVVSAQLWHTDPSVSDLRSDPGQQWSCIPYLEKTPGSGGGYLTSGNPIVRQFTCIPVDSKDPELAMLYLNWLAEMDNYVVIRAGYEGEHYDIKDGILMPRDEFKKDNSLLINNGITATYAMPFLPLDPVREMYQPETIELLAARRAREKDFYAAMYWTVPAIKDEQLDAGMSDYVTQVIVSTIMDPKADAAKAIDGMVDTLKANYNLEKQTQLVNEYAAEMGITR